MSSLKTDRIADYLIANPHQTIDETTRALMSSDEDIGVSTITSMYRHFQTFMRAQHRAAIFGKKAAR